MTAAAGTALRIGEVAERAGTTPRTVRYYEEIGLLPGSQQRTHGQHRVYTEADVERLTQILQLRDLLGLSLEELKQLIEAQDARAALREQWQRTEGDDAETRRGILSQSLGHIDRQLALVRGRRQELERLEHELADKRKRVESILGELAESD